MRSHLLISPFVRYLSKSSIFVVILSAGVVMAPALFGQSEGLVKKEAPATDLSAFGSPADVLASADAARDAGDLEKAMSSYKSIVHNAPTSSSAPKAQFALAQVLQKKGDLDAAFKAYQFLLQKYPQTPKFEESVAEEITIANAFLKGAKVRVFGIPTFSSMEKAEQMYTSILKVSPYSKHAAITQFNLGLSLEKQGKAQEAIAVYQKLLDKYPTSSAGDDAQYQIAYVYQRLGMTGKSQDLSALKESQNSYQDFLIQYPNSEKTQQAGENMKGMISKESSDTLRIGRFYDFSKDYKAAAIYYNDVIRRFPQSDDATAAKTRLDELKALYGEDTLRVGQERPENGERLAERRRLQAQVESSALSNYDGPSRKDIVGEEVSAPRPEMKGNMRDTQPIPLQEPPAQAPAQKTTPVTQ
jgi:outer membrane protein assembly factor BamD